MRGVLNAYVLAADPTWVERCVRAWYPYVGRLVVSYDPSDRGWTGAPTSSRAVVRAIQALDVDGKVQLLPGRWRDEADPMAADTAQRRSALAAAGPGAEWVLQLDTDELLPRPAALLEVLAGVPDGTDAVLWPMRVLYRHLGGERYAEVCAADGSPQHDYPGPIVVRAGTWLEHARRPVAGTTSLMLVAAGDTSSPSVRADPLPGELRAPLDPADAVVHNSWARPLPAVWAKTASWGHAAGWRGRAYVLLRWWPSRVLWRVQRNLHPISRSWWPRLRVVRVPADRG